MKEPVRYDKERDQDRQRQRDKERDKEKLKGKERKPTSDYFRLVTPQLFSKWNAINQVPMLNHIKDK